LHAMCLTKYTFVMFLKPNLDAQGTGLF